MYDQHIPFPVQLLVIECNWCRIAVHSVMKINCNPHKEKKFNQCKTQSENYDLATCVDKIGISCDLDTCSHKLREERSNIVEDENLSGLSRSSSGVVLGMEHSNYSIKCHVDSYWCSERGYTQD